MADDIAPDAASILSDLGVTPGERATETRKAAQEKRRPRSGTRQRNTASAPKEDDTPAPGAPLTPTERRLKDSVAEMYVMVSMGATFAGDPAIGMIIQQHADKAAESWVKLARKDARVKSLLNKLTTGSAYGDVIVVHIMMAFSILAAKGLLPGGMPGMPPMEEDPFTAEPFTGANAL